MGSAVCAKSCAVFTCHHALRSLYVSARRRNGSKASGVVSLTPALERSLSGFGVLKKPSLIEPCLLAISYFPTNIQAEEFSPRLKDYLLAFCLVFKKYPCPVSVRQLWLCTLGGIKVSNKCVHHRLWKPCWKAQGEAKILLLFSTVWFMWHSLDDYSCWDLMDGTVCLVTIFLSQSVATQ